VVALKLSSPEIQKNSVKPIFRPEIHTALIRQKVRPEFGAGQLFAHRPLPERFLRRIATSSAIRPVHSILRSRITRFHHRPPKKTAMTIA